MDDVARAGRTVLFVSHNMGAMRSLCGTGLLLDGRRVVQAGDISRCIEGYFAQVGAFQAETDAVEGQGSPSCGFGRVKINGGQHYSILHSEPFRAATTLRIDQEVSGFSLFCIIEDMQNRMVFHLREESPDLRLTSVSKGEYAIAVNVPALWLNAGLYSLHFKTLLWGKGDNARYLSDKIPLDVAGLHSRAEALLHPAVEWSVSAATARESAAEIFVPIETGKP